MTHRHHVLGVRLDRTPLVKAALIVLATAALASARADPVTWYLKDVTFDTGAVAFGSFTYDAASNTFSSIDVTVVGPSGTTTYQDVNPTSPGNSTFMSFVGQASSDMTGEPMAVFQLASAMSDAGGNIDMVPWPGGFSFQGFCSVPDCGANTGPYQDLAGGSITSGRTWYLDNVRYNTGATAEGSFTYDPAGNIFGNIDVTIDGPSGTTMYQDVNPTSPGNSTFMSFVGQASADMTGQPMAVFGLASAMTAAGGDIDMLPWPDGFSFQGFCTVPDCGANGGPYQDLTGGRITTGRTWYLDGVTTAAGGVVYGTFAYNADVNLYSNVSVSVDNGLTVNTYTQLHPLPLLNAQTLFLVAEASADMTGQNALYLDFDTALTNFGGVDDVKPWPTGSSSQGVCANDTCTLFEDFPDGIDAGHATTERPGPQFVSPTVVSVAENQTAAIDVQAVDIDASEGAGLAFSLTGGADQSLFAIDADFGVVTFLSAPNTAAPADADGDNTYDIEVTVTNPTTQSSVQAISVSVFAIPNIVLVQTDLDFGALAPTAPAQMLDLAFSNDGNASLEVSAIEITGPSASSFSADAGACIDTHPSMTGCTMVITFDPAADPTNGTKTATLTISSNDPDQPSVEVGLAAEIVVPDTDDDGLTDDVDNCLLIANTGQHDTDGDGFGNACDGDISPLPNDCMINFNDLFTMKNAFFATPGMPTWNPDADLVVNDRVDFADLGRLSDAFFGEPGPSALASCD